MKVNLTADTSQFSKGMKTAKADLRDFEKASQSGLSSIGQLFGVNTGKIQQMQGALRGLGQQMASSASTGVAGFGKLLTSVSGLSAGLAGLGIAGVVAGFKALNAEANNFKETVAGANMEMATAAYIDTYKQVLHDLNSDTGKAVAELESSWKKWWGKLGANVGGAFVTAVGKYDSWKDRVNAVKGFSSAMDDANDKARQAESISNRIYEIQRQQSDNMVRIAQLDAEIARQKEIAYDTTRSTSEQAAALAKAQELIRQKYAIQIPLATALANKMEEMNDLASSTPAQIDAANRARVEANNLAARENDEIRALSRKQATLNGQLAKESELRQQHLSLMQQVASMKTEAAALSAVNPITMPGAVATQQSLPMLVRPYIGPTEYQELLLSFDKYATAHIGDTTLVIGFEADMSKLTDITREVSTVITGLTESLSTSLGELVGDLMTGGDAWENFKSSALSAFGDLAVSVGKMAIATGTATLGIKAALESLNGYVAIAAGAALVALGSAVKAGLSNIASGNYSAGTNVATSAASSYSNDLATSGVTVNVSGTLKADGNQLIAVIENTNQKNSYIG